MVIEVHTSSSFCPFSSSSAVRCLLRTLNEPDSVLWVKEFAAIGSMPGEAPPQMIEIEAVGAIAILLEKRSMMPNSSASGQGPRSSASFLEAASASLRMRAKIFLRSEEHTSELQSLMRISYAVFCLKKKKQQ